MKKLFIDAKKYNFRRNLLFAGLLFLFFLQGCATVGKEFPVTGVTDIKIGETTQEQILTMFGSPWRTGIEDGQLTWTYGRYRYNLFKEARTKDLVVRFNDKNVVVSYTYNTTEHDK